MLPVPVGFAWFRFRGLSILCSGRPSSAGRTERRDPHSGVLAAAVPDESTVLATVLWTTRQSVEELWTFADPSLAEVAEPAGLSG